MGIAFGVDAGGENAGVAGEFALGEEAGAQDPSERIEPMHEASEAGGESRPKVAADVVAELVQDDCFGGGAWPVEGGFGEIDGRLEKSAATGEASWG